MTYRKQRSGSVHTWGLGRGGLQLGVGDAGGEEGGNWGGRAEAVWAGEGQDGGHVGERRRCEARCVTCKRCSTSNMSHKGHM